jgi:hypothetical protein
MKTLCILVALAAATTLAHAELGLPERRALKQYQETKYPELLAAIQTAAKFPVEVDVQWEAIALPDKGANYMSDEFWTDIFFVPLADALKAITVDDMGATAAKEKLKKVVITFDADTAPASNYPTGVKFEEGVLTINFHPYSNSAEVAARTKAIQSALEAGL